MQHATASPDLSRVLVGFGITAPSRTNVGDDESATTSETKSRNEIVASYVATARVPLLAARSRELRDIAAHAAALAAANDAVRERVAAAAVAWRRARGLRPSRVSACARAREEPAGARVGSTIGGARESSRRVFRRFFGTARYGFPGGPVHGPAGGRGRRPRARAACRTSSTPPPRGGSPSRSTPRATETLTRTLASRSGARRGDRERARRGAARVRAVARAHGERRSG